MTGHVVAVCIGDAGRLVVGGRSVTTGIDKRPVDGAVLVTASGVVGDAVVDVAHHGGPDQALYAYGQDDADHWVARLHQDLPPGSFGENLRLAGIDPSSGRIGERWALGPDAVVEVTAPRIPCRTFAAARDVPDLVPRFIAAGRPGAYLRVVVGGLVSSGDAVRMIFRPDHDLTVAEVSRIHTRDRDEAVRLVDLDGLGSRMRTWARNHVATLERTS